MTGHVNLLSGVAVVNGTTTTALSQIGGTPVVDSFRRVLVERPTVNLLPNPTLSGMKTGTIGGVYSGSGVLPTGYERGNTVNCDILRPRFGGFRFRFRRYSVTPTAINFIMRTPAFPGLTTTPTRGGIVSSGWVQLTNCSANVLQLTVAQIVYSGVTEVQRSIKLITPGSRPVRFTLWTPVPAGYTVDLSLSVDLTSSAEQNADFTADVECWDLQMEDAAGSDDATSFVAGTRASAQTVTLPTTGTSSVLIQTDKGGVWADGGANLPVPTDRSRAVEQVHIRPALTVAEKDRLGEALHPPRWDYTRQSSERFAFGGRNVEVQRPVVTRSFAVGANKRASARFELRTGDQWQPDIDGGRINQRSEIRFYEPAPYDTDVWLSQAMYVEPGATVTDFAIVGQWHATEDAGDIGTGPVWSQVLLPDGSFRVYTRGDAAAVQTVNQPQFNVYTDLAFQRGRWYRQVHRFRFSASGGGHLTSWIDGTQVYDGDTPMGYNDIAGPYYKVGIYKAPTTDTIVVRYANIEVGTGDLSDRVANPLPIA